MAVTGSQCNYVTTLLIQYWLATTTPMWLCIPCTKINLFWQVLP